MIVPVNALILWLAFRSVKRINAGFLCVLTGVLYAPVRFALDYLRPETTDPRYLSLTFAQWASLLAFGVAVTVLFRIMKEGAPAETITRTSREAQERLRVVLKGDDSAEPKGDAKAEVPKATATKKRSEPDEVEKALAKAKERKIIDEEEDEARASAVKTTPKADAKKADKADDTKTDEKATDDKKSDEKKTQ